MLDIVGHTDGNIINAAIQCILQNNTKEKASRYLTPFLGGLTPKFVTSLFNNVEKVEHLGFLLNNVDNIESLELFNNVNKTE